MTNNKPTDEFLEKLATSRVYPLDRGYIIVGDDLVAVIRELQERRKTGSAEPISFDALNAAVAEVTGGNQHAWNANIYKGHQEVPSMNYNSLARIVDKYRTPQPAPVVPEEIEPDDSNTFDYVDGWNTCRAAMLQAGNSPVIGVDPASGPDRSVEVRYFALPGYVMVPAKANIAMIRAGGKAAREYLEEHGGNSPQVIYQAMIAAAPQQEVDQ